MPETGMQISKVIFGVRILSMDNNWTSVGLHFNIDLNFV